MTDYRVPKIALQAQGPNSPFEVLQAVMSKVNQANLDSTTSEARAGLMKQLTPGQRTILAINMFEMECNSGGFDRYFRYEGGDFADEALAGTRIVGAAKFADVIGRAMALFPNAKPHSDTRVRAKQLDTLLQSNPHSFDEPLSAFFDSYEGEEDLATRLVDYIRQNPNDFFID